MAFVLSSVSGNLISAASAGYAPTNSADVSAIASAYQVVSATATQLYAGTAYLTGVNAAPISAERAGNAANAALATSAWYDGTGRLISALPDSAAVSSIASAYAESAASGKQDTLAFAYNTANQISSINGSALGGMDEAAVSGIASAYAESAASSKQDSSSMSAYLPFSAISADENSAITSINGSSIGGGGATGDYVEKSSYQNCLGTGNTVLGTSTGSTYLMNGTGISSNVGGSYAQLINGPSNTARANAFINGYGNYVSGGGNILGVFSEVIGEGLAVGSNNKLSGGGLIVGTRNSAYANSVCFGGYNSASSLGYAFGSGLKIKNDAVAFGMYNSANDGTNVALVIGDGYTYNDGEWHTANHDLMVVTKDGEITMYSSTADMVGTGIMSSIRAISAAATGGGGGIDSATCSAIASAYAESAVSSVSGDYYPMSGNPSSFALSSDVSGTVDLVSSQSANWGGSALALSAGPGVTLTKSGDTLVAGLDETVLFSGQTATTATMNLNEAYTNFEYIDLIGHWDYNGTDRMCAYNRIPTSASIFSLGGIGIGSTAAANYDMFMCANEYSSNGTSVVVRKVSRINLQNTLSSNSDGIIVDKIIGINRTAGV